MIIEIQTEYDGKYYNLIVSAKTLMPNGRWIESWDSQKYLKVQSYVAANIPKLCKHKPLFFEYWEHMHKF